MILSVDAVGGDLWINKLPLKSFWTVNMGYCFDQQEMTYSIAHWTETDQTYFLFNQHDEKENGAQGKKKFFVWKKKA